MEHRMVHGAPMCMHKAAYIHSWGANDQHTESVDGSSIQRISDDAGHQDLHHAREWH